MMKNNTSGVSLFLLWTCGASLRITVLAVPPVISIIQQDLHLSATENRTAIRRTGHPIRDCRNAGVDIDHPLWRSQHVANRPCDRCHWGCAAGRNFEPWQLYLTSIVMSSGIAIMNPAMAAAARTWIPERATFGT